MRTVPEYWLVCVVHGVDNFHSVGSRAVFQNNVFHPPHRPTAKRISKLVTRTQVQLNRSCKVVRIPNRDENRIGSGRLSHPRNHTLFDMISSQRSRKKRKRRVNFNDDDRDVIRGKCVTATTSKIPAVPIVGIARAKATTASHLGLRAFNVRIDGQRLRFQGGESGRIADRTGGRPACARRQLRWRDSDDRRVSSLIVA